MNHLTKFGILCWIIVFIGIPLSIIFGEPEEAIGWSIIIGAAFGGIGIAFIVKGRDPYWRQQAELDETRKSQNKNQILPKGFGSDEEFERREFGKLLNKKEELSKFKKLMIVFGLYSRSREKK